MSRKKSIRIETFYVEDKLNLFRVRFYQVIDQFGKNTEKIKLEHWPRLIQHINKYGFFKGLSKYFQHKRAYRTNLIVSNDFHNRNADVGQEFGPDEVYYYGIKKLKNGMIKYKVKFIDY